MRDIQNKELWQKFFKNWKEVWRNPEVYPYTKLVLFDVLLYRSDENGWNISERKLAYELGIGKQTASKAIDDASKRGWLLTGDTKQRERRKLRLSGFLQSPVRTTSKPTPWVSTKPTKYQPKYQKNIGIIYINKNPIINDQLFQRLLKLDTSKDGDFRLKQSLLTKLDGIYPNYKHEKEWKEARTVLAKENKL